MRLFTLLLLMLALPARMAWAEVMPLKMGPWPAVAVTAHEVVPAIEAHADCHDAMDDAAPQSGKPCSECAACHALAVVMPVSGCGVSPGTTVRLCTGSSMFRSAEAIRPEKPPIS